MGVGDDPEVEAFRARFPIFENKTYLASCSQGALSSEVRAAFEAYLQTWDHDGNPWQTWVEETERLRCDVAALINADPDEIAVTFSASSALNSIVGALNLSERPRVVCTDWDFPTVGHILLAQRQRGARVSFVSGSCGTAPVEAIADQVNKSTALVAAPHVSFLTGGLFDAAAIANAAHREGALFLLDAYQSAGVIDIDVRALGVDILVTGALKYLLGPPGIAFLYVRRECIERLSPLDSGWFAQANPFSFDAHSLDYARSAKRFQSGSPSVPSVYGARAGLWLISSVGPLRIEPHVKTLGSRLLASLHETDIPILTPETAEERGPMIVIKTARAEELAARLLADGFVCSPRGEGLRIALHYYNTASDIDQLMTALCRHRDLVKD